MRRKIKVELVQILNQIDKTKEKNVLCPLYTRMALVNQ